MRIETADDWWALFNTNRTNIEDMLGMFVATERQYMAVRLKDAADTRDAYKLARVLNAIWYAAPDSPAIHSLPGWGALCDLCSEEWAVCDEKERR